MLFGLCRLAVVKVRYIVTTVTKIRGHLFKKGSSTMEAIVNEVQTKALLKQVVLELLQEKRPEFYQIVLEAMEEIGLANAIHEGRRDEFVSEEQITAILAG
jgi:hypothetical protein